MRVRTWKRDDHDSSADGRLGSAYTSLYLANPEWLDCTVIETRRGSHALAGNVVTGVAPTRSRLAGNPFTKNPPGMLGAKSGDAKTRSTAQEFAHNSLAESVSLVGYRLRSMVACSACTTWSRARMLRTHARAVIDLLETTRRWIMRVAAHLLQCSVVWYIQCRSGKHFDRPPSSMTLRVITIVIVRRGKSWMLCLHMDARAEEVYAFRAADAGSCCLLLPLFHAAG